MFESGGFANEEKSAGTGMTSVYGLAGGWTAAATQRADQEEKTLALGQETGTAVPHLRRALQAVGVSAGKYEQKLREALPQGTDAVNAVFSEISENENLSAAQRATLSTQFARSGTHSLAMGAQTFAATAGAKGLFERGHKTTRSKREILERTLGMAPGALGKSEDFDRYLQGKSGGFLPMQTEERMHKALENTLGAAGIDASNVGRIAHSVMSSIVSGNEKAYIKAVGEMSRAGPPDPASAPGPKASDAGATMKELLKQVDLLKDKLALINSNGK
jgi:hypothetical protein